MQVRLAVIVCLTAGKAVKVMFSLTSEINVHHMLIKLPNPPPIIYLSFKTVLGASTLKLKFLFNFYRDLSYNQIYILNDTLFCCVKKLEYL